ncbi:MAG: DNA polymerase III subunit chi [Wenzhouxiangellaceae bacterium]
MAESSAVRVDFYELHGRFADPLAVATVLISKAWPQTREVVVRGRAELLEALDRRLWEKPAGRFLPHAIDDPLAPIRLVTEAPARAELLLELDPHASIPDGRYDRVLELVPGDPGLRERLRARWRAWKRLGARLEHHLLK